MKCLKCGRPATVKYGKLRCTAPPNMCRWEGAVPVGNMIIGLDLSADKRICGAMDPGSSCCCTKPPGHPGHHAAGHWPLTVASAGKGAVLARWPQEEVCRPELPKPTDWRPHGSYSHTLCSRCGIQRGNHRALNGECPIEPGTQDYIDGQIFEAAVQPEKPTRPPPQSISSYTMGHMMREAAYESGVSWTRWSVNWSSCVVSVRVPLKTTVAQIDSLRAAIETRLSVIYAVEIHRC